MSKLGVHQLHNSNHGGNFMNAVGIDVSKGHSTVTVLRPFGEVVLSPFEVNHTVSELKALAKTLKSLSGETRVVMECTGNYHLPIANALQAAGLFVSTRHAGLLHNYNNDTIRNDKNDPADSIKCANYCLDKWLKLTEYIPEDAVRQSLKAVCRQYTKYGKIKTMLVNNFISLLDLSFPGINELFTSPPRKSDGHEKWLDFTIEFWHADCVAKLSLNAFTERYKKWCKRMGYNAVNASGIHSFARKCVAVIPKSESTKLLITEAVKQINSICETIFTFAKEMKRLAETLPEYPIVMAFFGVGDILGPQIIAEVGDVRNYPKKSSTVRFAGLEPVDNSSGKFHGDKKISKKGSPHLRKSLFQVMDCLIQRAPADDPIFQFLDRKRSEGKHYYSYMCAGSAKFLRVYYARVMEYLKNQNLA
jgi:transposase